MRRRSSRRRRSLKSSSHERRRLFVIFTEGKKTEPSYLNHWARRYREKVIVVIHEGQGVPRTLVARAARKRREDRPGANTEYWCVFDRDKHPGVADAKQMARDNGLNVAFSNPCIELWFILHFKDQEAFVERGQAQRESRHLLANRNKGLPSEALEVLEARFESAKKRAQRLDRKHAGDGRPPGSNPSTDIWKLVD